MAANFGRLLLMVSAVAFGGMTTGHSDAPTLKLKAPRMTFVHPRMPNEPRAEIVIRVTASIENKEKIGDPEKYYCLEEVWEWDDDTESTYAPDCEPYKEGAELKTFFSASHQYRDPGSYNIYLRLQRNGKTILAGNVRVQIGD